jgi:hypothetical protein
LRGKDSPQFKAHLKPARDYFGAWRAVDVTSEGVDDFIRNQLDGNGEEGSGKSVATVNRSTQLLAPAFKLAVQRKKLATAPMIRHLSEKGNARKGILY